MGRKRTAVRKHILWESPIGCVFYKRTFTKTKAMAPQAGKVRSHTAPSAPATLPSGEAPAPKMAADLAWVVDTGRPQRVQRARVTAQPSSAAKPERGFSRTIFRPTVSMMRRPPRRVPRAMRAAQAQQALRGRENSPAPKVRIRASTPRNFCPS